MKRQINLADEEGKLREDCFWRVLAHANFPECEASIEQAVFLLRHERQRFVELGDNYTSSHLSQPITSALKKKRGRMFLCGLAALALIYRRAANPRESVNGAIHAIAALRQPNTHFAVVFEDLNGTQRVRLPPDPAKIRRAFQEYRSVAHIHAARIVAGHYLTTRHVLDFIPEADLCVVRTAAMFQRALLEAPHAKSWNLWHIVGAEPGELLDDFPALVPPFELVQPLMRTR